MTIEMAVDILHTMMLQSIMLITPIMSTAIAMGLGVSLFQTVTSIQEQTLTFVPKLLGVAVVMMVSANWMLRSLTEFATVFIQRLPDMAK